MSAEPTAWSLLPPLLALALALTSRRVVPSLAAGGLAGAALIALSDAGGGPAGIAEALWRGALGFVELGVLGQPAQPGNAQVMVLIALIGGFVHLLERSGAARALTAGLASRVRSPRQAQLATWLGGIALFFSDFGNVLILGPVFRPLYDRLGLAREKLAWIIDTTAAPICVMVPVIAWGVYAIGLIEAGFAGLDPAAVEASLPGIWRSDAGTVDGLGAFMAALPWQLYPIGSLLAVPLIVAAGWTPGPMARAQPVGPEPAGAPGDGADGQGASASAALAPLAILFVVGGAVGAWQIAAEGRLTGASVRLALACAYLAAIGGCLAILRRQGLAEGAGAAIVEGVGRSAPLLILLVLAWTLGAVCGELGTGAWIAAAVGGGLPAALLPLAIFLVGAATSFATGTSWGTFAILTPIAIQLAVHMGAPAAIAIGAVLSGGVFGDHTSPISDTTLLASMGAGVEHADHVATQLPYALTVGAAAALGFLIAGTVS